MKKFMKAISAWCVLMMTVMMLSGIAFASADDNSLYSLGINTEGATVEPEFDYSVWECTVTVPAGTKELSLSPVTSSESATIADIQGTTLAEDGTGTVYITVRSASGSDFTYTVHVVSDGPAPVAETQPQTETEPETQAPQTEPETEPQTEDSRYVKVDKNTIQEAENTITSLKNEITNYKETVSLYTKVMYGLIAAAVIMLFIIINMAIRGRDIKSELRELKLVANGQQGMSKKEMKRAAKEAKKAEKAAKKAAKKAEKQGAPQPQQTPVNAAPMQQTRPMPQPQNIAPQARNMQQPPQRVPHRQVVPQNVGGLDVVPQVSRKPATQPQKAPTAPMQNAAAQPQKAPAAPMQNAAAQPQKAPAAPTQNAAPQPQKAPVAPAKKAAPQPEAPAPAKKGGNVEVNMIDL